ncbi:hypothetical protein VNO78_34177 [Psophocarpus tetragonolobus]|uniref:Cell wall hydroxyproline-rich glycoprotein n=1 Tax=Psophocarpus tetragonolobus TaxID=3891 RepID=A0AAN9NVJ5_PSOTE
MRNTFSTQSSMMARTKSIFFFFSLLLILGVVAAQEVAKSESEALGKEEEEKRETLEIIIGGGGGSPAPSPESPCPPPPPSRLEKAKRVLLRFKTLIDDPNCYTQTWTQNRNVCDFRGVRCAPYPNTKEPAVAGVDLNGARVTGQNGCPLPVEGTLVDQIPELTFFHVNSNGFAGGVPKGITKFPFFYELDLSNNRVTGNFPIDAITAKTLVFLDLRFNRLTGSIPAELFTKDLDVIFVNNNQFTQSLPENFGSTTARYLTFANNKLSGALPRSVGYAPNLTEVLFLNNSFQGCLPFEIGYLKKAVVFDVSKNSLTGPIPLSFGCLKSIRYLNLEQNKFYGVVPDNLCMLPSLRNNGNISLADNYFKEIGPSCWSLIKSKVLDVSRNCIPGLPNQKSPKECYDFYCKIKACPNPNSLYYVPCKSHWGNNQSPKTGPPSAPVTYNTLKPHRLRL